MSDKPVQVIEARKVMLFIYAMCAVLLVLGVVSTVLIVRDGNRVDELDSQQARIAKALKASCVGQGYAFAGILTNTALLLETAQNLKDNAADPAVRKFYSALAPALTATLDSHFAKPPRCGEKFTFEIKIEGQKKRRVTTPGR